MCLKGEKKGMIWKIFQDLKTSVIYLIVVIHLHNTVLLNTA